MAQPLLLAGRLVAPPCGALAVLVHANEEVAHRHGAPRNPGIREGPRLDAWALEAHHVRPRDGLRLRATSDRHPEGGRLLHGLWDLGSVTVTGTFGHDAPPWCLGQGPY